METINLTDIIDDIFLNCPGDTTKFWAKTLAKQCALEFGKQVLELAAENVNAYIGYSADDPIVMVDKQSILDTIKQVE